MSAAPPIAARDIHVTGVVQGVGFRPFVHRLADRHGLSGWVRNVAGAVDVRVEGDPLELDAFARALRAEAPPLARIDGMVAAFAVPRATAGFRIIESVDASGARPVPADVATCPRCEAELFDPANRRFRHPFITCTDCGPRYTVIRELPYDRERTSMAAFDLCPRCAAEYHTPADRRHHAETIACNACGPRAWLAGDDGVARSDGDGAIRDAAALLAIGRIGAIRGVGGFHLACDAADDRAVAELRRRKQRDAKPFAVMVRTVDDVRTLAHVSAAEAALLQRPERPIVLLRRRPGRGVAAGVAPRLELIGVMLAYTALHHMLLEAIGRPLVMTSGNVSDEPIAIDNAEARVRLRGVADFFLFHDREILSRVDDSIARVVDDVPVVMRRARGYAPRALRLPVATPYALIAVGPHLKNTFTLADGPAAFVSPHIGDLDSVESLAHFRGAMARFRDLFRVAPEVAVHDAHPGYLSTGIARDLCLPMIAVQHHHAHVAAVAAEHGVTHAVAGLAFDGTGAGDDGHTWGAEAMVADLSGFRRVAHLRYAPLPGGDRAAREPWRAAAGYLSLEPGVGAAFALAFDGIAEDERDTVERQLARRVNAPLASSMGRLFDAAAAVLGVRRRASYEGQAAMELESLAGTRRASPIDMPLVEQDGDLVLDPLPLLAALGERRRRGVPVDDLAAVFHESVVCAAVRLARVTLGAAETSTVVLAGGSFQNARLLSGVRRALDHAGVRVLAARELPPNDGAISYGQAAIAAARLAGGVEPGR